MTKPPELATGITGTLTMNIVAALAPSRGSIQRYAYRTVSGALMIRDGRRINRIIRLMRLLHREVLKQNVCTVSGIRIFDATLIPNSAMRYPIYMGWSMRSQRKTKSFQNPRWGTFRALRKVERS